MQCCSVIRWEWQSAGLALEMISRSLSNRLHFPGVSRRNKPTQDVWSKCMRKILWIMSWRRQHEKKEETNFHPSKPTTRLFTRPGIQTAQIRHFGRISISKPVNHVIKILKQWLFTSSSCFSTSAHLDARVLLQRWKANPGLTLPARPRLCSMFVLDAHTVA